MSDWVTDRTSRSGVCPSFVAAMQVLGKRWNAIIIKTIGESRLRYSQLKEQVAGISDAVLTARLSELTGCGLLVREITDSGRRAEYRLTGKGRELVTVLEGLTDWADRWDMAEQLNGSVVGSAS